MSEYFYVFLYILTLKSAF